VIKIRTKTSFQTCFVAMTLTMLFLPACSPSSSPAGRATGSATVAGTAPAAFTAPDWFSFKLTDVRTGQTFNINDFAGKVVLIGTIAEWCPNCIFQQLETRKLRTLLGDPKDLILVSLDVDSHEDEASLKKYTEEFGFDWRFGVASLEVDRALGNLYSAEYLNPPLDPMLLIDRNGNTYNLPYGIKSAETLQQTLEPYLAK
jgi:cytochrome oxidase Cu insertion factor (SCO1/SenC/PrrC family)